MIFDSDKIIPDDEFEELGKQFCEAHPEFHFKYGINLEGIRKEFWQRKEETAHKLIMDSHGNYPVIETVNNAFEDLSNLFNINE